MNYDYANANLYMAAGHAFKTNIPALTFVVAMSQLLELLQPILDVNLILIYIGDVVLSAVLAFAIHQTILNGKIGTWRSLIEKGDENFTALLWRSFALGMIFVVTIAIGLLLSFLVS